MTDYFVNYGLQLMLFTLQNKYKDNNLRFVRNSQSLKEMISLKQQKHLLYFDQESKCFSSFLFQIKEKQDLSDKKQKNKESNPNQANQINGFINSSFTLADVLKLNATFRVQNSFTHKWQSEFYDLKIQQPWGQMPKFHKIPLSLDTFFSLYKNPLVWRVAFTLKSKYIDSKFDQKQILNVILKNNGVIGKLIITTNFSQVKKKTPFKLPVNMCSMKDINLEAKKVIKIIALKDQDTIICSGKLYETQICQKVFNFSIPIAGLHSSQFSIYTYYVSQRVKTEDICILKHKLNVSQFEFNKVIFKIMSPEQPKFIPILAKILQSLRTMLEPEPLIIVQNVDTPIESCHGIVFYSDLMSLPQRIFRSYLFDKIQDKWLIQGMINYTRSNKNFQDCMAQLIDMMNQGEEFFPLVNDIYSFDEVWKAKAKFFFYVLANFKTTRDYGSSSLVGLILQYSKKKKINSTYLFRRLKKKYGLDGAFRSTYEEQFIKCTGLNRIFYELIDIRRDNSVKFIVRQKSLLNKFFKTYNLFRIKLQQTYGELSPLMERIMKKNRYEQQSSKRKDLPGPLAIPQFIKCLPYFRGKMTVQSDACEPFQLQMIEQNVIEKTKQSSSLRARPANRKPGQIDKGTDGFNWMMIDTAYVFPAVYKNENVHENVILQRIKKVYESQQEQIKVLNCISSTNHSQNQEICRALLQKLKMQPKALNTTLSVKRKILQIIPMFINKLKDSTIWQNYYALFQLYEPPCYDYSDDGYQFMMSLIQSSTNLIYRKQFAYYFNEVHRILLAILLNHQILNSEQKELKLKNLLYKSLMKWKSKYSFEILKQIYDILEALSLNVRNNLISLKVIIEGLLPFLDQIQQNNSSKIQLINSTRDIILRSVQKDESGQLYSIYFFYELTKEENNLNTIDFLRFSLKKLQKLEQAYTSKNQKQQYWLCLKQFKDILNQNKMKYGLKIQLDELNEDQNYFLAEYLWCKLTSKISLIDEKVRLQWLKIYRIFYFYFTPIITIHKLRKNLKSSLDQFSMSESQIQQVLTGCAQLSFIPDIRWMSGYDSSGAKEQKAKYQQYNLENNRRKRKFQQLSFEDNNIITRFIKQNPGKDSWQDIAREALRIIIVIEEKKQVDNPEKAERFKKIVQGLKGVQNNLKRGNMPNDYSLDKVKIQAQYVMRRFQEDTQKLEEVFVMVNSTVEAIKQQRRQKELQRQNQMKIFLPKDWMFVQDEQGNVGDLKPLHAIKQHPEQQYEEDERKIMRKIVEQDKNDEQPDQLNVHRYESIFDQ